jgi:hypothetical protein
LLNVAMLFDLRMLYNTFIAFTQLVSKITMLTCLMKHNVARNKCCSLFHVIVDKFKMFCYKTCKETFRNIAYSGYAGRIPSKSKFWKVFVTPMVGYGWFSLPF